MSIRTVLATGVTMLALSLTSLPAAPQSVGRNGDAQLRALYTAEWEWRQRELIGDLDEDNRAAADHLPHVDAATQQAHLQYWLNILAKLDRIPLDELSPEERINAQVFRAIIEAFVTDVRFKAYEAPFTSDTFFWTSFTPLAGLPSAEAYSSYIGRLRDIPRYFDEQIANMRAGMARGFTVPRVAIAGRDKTIEPYLKSDDTNPLFAPFTKMPVAVTPADQARLQAEARAVIAERTIPGYRNLLSFVRNDYLAKARTTIGASSLPDGDAYYQAMIERYTTLRLTPEQIHEIGRGEVARIKAEMQATMMKTGFKGTLAEFMLFLRTDPQFYARTPRELLATAAYLVKKAEFRLKDTIGFLPRFRHGILPVPEALAPIYTGGRGGLETCLFNTYNLPARPLYTLPALALHECTPGHSFQAALALEEDQRPPFRNAIYFSGYSEGWGLYTEWLGTLMGMYETPYEEFGRQTYEMWRAVRLVVDTGIHHYGWSRERAIEYMKDNVALSDHEITTEIDRYISWPGQADSYKLGELQIRRHRREAESALDVRFDQRKFHDAILALGSVPLPVLAERMAKFIADGGENPPREAPVCSAPEAPRVGEPHASASQ